jgi:maleate isomerase
MSDEPVLPRARLGFIIPSSNRMVEPDMRRFLPAGIEPHFTRIGMTNRHRAPLDVLLPRILEAADLLNDSRCDIVAFQCTGASMSGGVDMDQRVTEEIARTTGKPSISTASAVSDALKKLGARRIVFVSETPQERHDKKRAFLEEAGFEIVADRAAGLSGSDEYCTTPPRFWFDTAVGLRNDAADAYFISCANIQSTAMIEDIELAVDRPVITSNQAALWSALRTVGINDSIPRLGRLLRQ